jgi:hypothetical protein
MTYDRNHKPPPDRCLTFVMRIFLLYDIVSHGMKRLGETYDRASGSKASVGQRSSSKETPSDQSSLPSRESICVGDVIAVLFGGVVFCLGVILWISSIIGLFDGNVIGMQRLAELTVSLGIDTIVIWVLLLHSFGQGTRSRGKRPPPHLNDSPTRLSSQYLNLGKLLHLSVLLFSGTERHRL